MTRAHHYWDGGNGLSGEEGERTGEQSGAGLKPMQPMQLRWALRHGVWVDNSFLPDTPCA